MLEILALFLEIIQKIISLVTTEAFVDFFLVFGGASAFGIYVSQKKAEQKSAFTIILNQIDSVETSIAKLRDAKAENNLGNPSVYKSDPIITQNHWSQYKHLVMNKLDQTDIKLLDEFFYNAEQINIARQAIIKIMDTSWDRKCSITQELISDLLSKEIENINIQEVEENDILEKSNELNTIVNKKISLFLNAFYRNENIFTPDIPVSILIKHLSLYSHISISPTYKKIKKFSFNK